MKRGLSLLGLLSLAPVTLACEGASSASEPEVRVSATGAVETVRVAANGRELVRVGEVRRVQRLAVAPPVTDAEIEQIENARTERVAVRRGVLAEAPSGQTLDFEGKPLRGVLSDFDDGEYYGAPIEGADMDDLRAAYEAGRPVEGSVKGESVEPGAPARQYKSVRGADGRTQKTSAERNAFPFTAILEYSVPLSREACEGEGVAYPCSSSCTATLIDPDHATTAAHCVYSRADDAWIFAPDGTRGEVCNNTGCVDVILRHRSADYDDTLLADFSEDFAVLDLAGSPPDYEGDFTLSSLDMGDGATLKSKTHYNYGYAGDKPDGLWGMSCNVNYVGDDRLGYDCDTAGGHSGGPVYYRNGDTRYQTAIHAGSAVFHNTGPAIGEIRDWIISLL